MATEYPITVEDVIAELKRDLAAKKKSYQQWVKDKKISQPKAEKILACIAATLSCMQEFSENRGFFPNEFWETRQMVVDLETGATSQKGGIGGGPIPKP
jgi:hypothetical protein